jgi:hypothetical protein
MKMVRQVIVFDAAELQAESAFWAALLGGHVFEDDKFHSVIDAAGEWRIGVQLAPNLFRPTGRVEAPNNKCTSTCTSKTRELRMKRPLDSVPDCSKQDPISMPPKATRCTPTPPGIPSASGGDNRPERRSRHSCTTT